MRAAGRRRMVWLAHFSHSKFSRFFSILGVDEIWKRGRGKKVAVGISGGVDSAVAAWILKERGFDTFGVFMRNWDPQEEEEDGECTASQDFLDAKSVCKHLGIPLQTADYVPEYWNHVFQPFIDGFSSAKTPNPDIHCNKEIKFKYFAQDCLTKFGADYFATGHYAQIAESPDNPGSPIKLLRGVDPAKDQSFFLNSIPQESLRHVIFPVGNLLKSTIREIAQREKFPNANKRDSFGICFIGKRKFKDFLARFVSTKRGNFVTIDGEVLAAHDGVNTFTIGQGARIAGLPNRWYVAKKNVDSNELIVVDSHMHPALFADHMIVNDVHWISGVKPPSHEIPCQVQIRNLQDPIDCIIYKSEQEDDTYKVVLSKPQRAIAPKQGVAFYQGNEVLGGGMIDKVGPSYYDMKCELPKDVSC
eukprot:TRINITY_DN6082_c0_g1_i1.p1 TRINITY_DN6082_c0_g1~~TRINITY_DN6082_c0_g1_i1.p1  ORF type:complete len:417 (+),score=56.33 TRINITY_DN6082_c0_g1_i1:26-1276(+)